MGEETGRREGTGSCGKSPFPKSLPLICTIEKQVRKQTNKTDLGEEAMSSPGCALSLRAGIMAEEGQAGWLECLRTSGVPQMAARFSISLCHCSALKVAQGHSSAPCSLSSLFTCLSGSLSASLSSSPISVTGGALQLESVPGSGEGREGDGWADRHSVR